MSPASQYITVHVQKKLLANIGSQAGIYNQPHFEHEHVMLQAGMYCAAFKVPFRNSFENMLVFA